MRQEESNQDSANNLAELLTQKTNSSIVLMRGEMGSGKTTFTRMLGQALGIKQNITSPTFVGLHEYHSSKISLYHLDLYQVAFTYYDLKELLLRPSQKKIFVIEWAEKLSNRDVELLKQEGYQIIDCLLTVCDDQHLIFRSEH